jgi:hypothetical protein
MRREGRRRLLMIIALCRFGNGYDREGKRGAFLGLGDRRSPEFPGHISHWLRRSCHFVVEYELVRKIVVLAFESVEMVSGANKPRLSQG